MRSIRTVTTPNPRHYAGHTMAIVSEVRQHDVSDALATVLAFATLEGITLDYPGHQVHYTAWQYPCTWCGEYNAHRSDDCPILDPTDDGDD